MEEKDVKIPTDEKIEQSECEESTMSEENLNMRNYRKKRKGKDMVEKHLYDELQDQYVKALTTAAHHENLRKYYQAEYERSLKYRSQTALELMLPALDGFQMAFKFPAPTKEAENYRVGFEFVYKLLIDALGSEGMEQFTPKVGETYDPINEQAIESIETEDSEKNGTIAQVLLNGYRLKDRLIRPASVKIYVKKKEDLQIESKETQQDNNVAADATATMKN
jgi:molecular chaperone GrpE